MNQDREKYDQIVLELESTRHELEASKETVVSLTNSRLVDQEQLASLSLEIEKSESRSSKHSKFEEVLQKQISELQTKLESAHQGRQAESEMAQDALKKTSQLERSITELTAKLKGLMDENADLKEQLYEHQTTKSCDSHKVNQISFKLHQKCRKNLSGFLNYSWSKTLYFATLSPEKATKINSN